MPQPLPSPLSPDAAAQERWPNGDFTVIPDWIYTSEAIYAREIERIFHGPTWSFVALEAEIPNAGDFRRSYVGETPVVVTRGAEGDVHVFQNRCAHRGVEFCRRARGNTSEFVCPYHQWTYDLRGNLIGVPFRRGVRGKGGMPADFRLEENGTLRLQVARRGGVVFASFAGDVEPLDSYLGAEIITDFDATFDGRPLRILGYYRNTMPGNWKLYHENLKDPYHATLLHTYLVTFGLLAAGQKSAMIADRTGRHGTMASARGEEDPQAVRESKGEMRAFRENMHLNDGRILDYISEFRSPWSVTMQTIWPNLIVQRELNTLGIRQIVPRGPHEIEMHWVMFGYQGDSAEMTRHRLRQGNLMGPAGFLGMEDNEAMGFEQEGFRASLGQHGQVRLGGAESGGADHLITESAIRGMYRYYAGVMGLAP
jgi:phenylpropionate dioxygenase-like ring-hydroxylating dioxygenase large terminal subunit